MGISTAGRIAERLITHGMDPGIPVAVVENGTLPSQKLVSGTLGTLEASIAERGIAGPALLIIGSVAGLAAGATAEAIRRAG